MTLPAQVKSVMTWGRALSNEDLKIVTSWNRLSDRAPEQGQKCEYRVIAQKFSGETETGIWTTVTEKFPDAANHSFGAFNNDNGMLFADNKYVFWRPVQASAQTQPNPPHTTD